MFFGEIEFEPISDNIAFHAVLTSYDTIPAKTPVIFNEVILNKGNGWEKILIQSIQAIRCVTNTQRQANVSRLLFYILMWFIYTHQLHFFQMKKALIMYKTKLSKFLRTSVNQLLLF